MDTDNIKYFPKKVINRIRGEKNRFWKHLNISGSSMRGFKSFSNAETFKFRLQTMLGVYDFNLLFGTSKEDKELILNSAEQALRHEFDLLGSGRVTLDPIDWLVDFKCGAKWEKNFYREIGYIKGADIKMPWELSRCQHLLWLGEAYLLTNDKKYAKEVVDEINLWIDDNPLMYSVNWKCAMDVAFRAVNWMFALNMIHAYEGFDNTFADKVSRSLWQHGFFIRNNLEKVIPDSNNHYSSDLVGLLYLGVLFDNTRKRRRWKKFAINELISETRNQILPSGIHYERSVSYHRMMTEMLSYPVYMLHRIGENLPEDIIDRIKSMYGYIANYTKPNGLAPLIADNDDGRFLPFIRRDFRVHNYLNDPESIENRIVSAGMIPWFCVEKKETRLYEDANVAIVHKDKDYMFINNGGYSKRPKENQITIGTHTHNDLLSFELAMNGQDIIVDAGTYLYTSTESDRNAFRSTAKHNTVMVDGEEQNGFLAPFVLKRNVHIGKLIQKSDNSFEGNYVTREGKTHHLRSFLIEDGVYVIKDALTKEGVGHVANLYFHFAKGAEPSIQGDDLVVENMVRISFSVKPNKLEVFDDTISPSFGVLASSKTAKLTYGFDNSIQLITKISHING